MQEGLHFLDTVGWIATMVYHCMTVRTHRAKVSDSVNFVLFANFRELEQVVDVDKSIHDLSVGDAERETTYIAVGSIFLDASLAS